MIETKILSIIVPVYNVENYIKECLESLIAIKSDNIEIIIVNDGSTDKSIEICEIYKKIDKRVRIVSKINGGLSDARNRGIIESESKYLLFVDSDDYIDSSELDKILNKIKKLECDVIMNSYNEFKENKILSREGTNKELKENFYYKVSDELIENIFEYTIGIWPAWRFIVRKEFLEKNKINFKKGFLHEDVDYTTRILLNMDSFYYNNNGLYYYRVCRKGSIVNSKKFKSLKDTVEIINDLEKFIEMKNYNKQTKNKIDDCFARSIYCNLNLYEKGTEKEKKDILSKLKKEEAVLGKSKKVKHKLFYYFMKLIGMKKSVELYCYICKVGK